MRIATLEGEQLAWTYVLAAYEGGLPSASYLGMLADAAEAADAPADYVAALRPAALPLHRAVTSACLGFGAMSTHSADNVTCTVDDEGIARVWLDRPDKLNGLTLPMLRELAATARRLSHDRTLRAVILTGAGRVLQRRSRLRHGDARPARASHAPSSPTSCAARTPSRRRPGRGAGCPCR